MVPGRLGQPDPPGAGFWVSWSSLASTSLAVPATVPILDSVTRPTFPVSLRAMSLVPPCSIASGTGLQVTPNTCPPTFGVDVGGGAGFAGAAGTPQVEGGQARGRGGD